jgi:putative ABC transport system ATP-binding protein
VFDVKGKERDGMTVEDLLEKFAQGTGRSFNNDRILLSTEQGD